MNTPSLGIIGGYGPATSAIFCQRLVEYAQQINQEYAPSIVLDSIPISFKDAALCIAGDLPATRRLVHAANDGFRRLGAMGIKHIALPCNSVHALADEFEVPDGATFHHIADVCADRVQELGYKRIGMLASGLTRNAGFYADRLSKRGIEVVESDAALQGTLNDAISTYVSSGKLLPWERECCANALADLEAKNVDAVALCCTDISSMLIVGDVHSRLPVVDSMDALARACARISMERELAAA